MDYLSASSEDLEDSIGLSKNLLYPRELRNHTDIGSGNEPTSLSSPRTFIFKQLHVTAANIVDYDENEQIEAFEMDRHSQNNRLSYIYGTLLLIFFCILSVAINIKILMSVHWIRRPLSPTLHISLSLAGADAFSSTALAIGLVMNSFIPHGLGLELPGVGCFLLGLEAVRLGGVMITVGHLVALAVNHYFGILRPLHHLTIMTHRITTLLIILIWTWPLSFFFAYFSAIDDEGFQSRNCETNTFLFKKKFRVMFSSLFFGPFMLMVCIYAHIFRIVRRHQASRLRFSRAGSSFRRTPADNSADRQAKQSASQQMARNVKAINTTLFILGSFVVGWMPATFLYVLVCEDCLLKFDWITGNAKFLVYNASNCLIILKTLVNPIIYAARMHEIQVATRRMHSSLCGFCVATNYTDERNRMHSSEGPINHRAISISRGAICRSTISTADVTNKNNPRRDDTYRYTYRGIKKNYPHDNTFV